METKILFADIDGTLLNDQKEIPKENRIDCLQEKLLKAEITFPNCDYESEQQIQEMIRNNARAIARIIVTSK